MSDPPNITSLLAALAQRGNAAQAGIPPVGQPGIPAGYPNPYASQTPPAPVGGFGLPQPANTGNIDLSAIKPISSGTVSIADAIAKARGIAAEKGIASDNRGRGGRSPNFDDNRGRNYNRRSHSRSPPPRRDNYRDNYNPYRDERRNDRRDFQRDRSQSPPEHRNRRGGGGYGGRGDRSPPTRGGLGDDSELIQIDSTLVGLIIGRQGENLRRVEQDTGCRVQFITGPDVSGPRRDCKITGPQRARDDAKVEIARIIEENGRQPGNSNLGLMPSGRHYGSSSTPSQAQPSQDGGEDSTQIMVPDRTVGLIIGRGGETIRDLQEKSGCHVNIVGEQKSVNGLRPVNLIGPPRAAQIAKDLIMEIVQSDNKNMGDGGAGAPSGGAGGRDAPRYGSNSIPTGSGEKTNGNIVVPSSAVGMIIGRGGETIKEMQNQSGCKINVSPQTNPNETERSIGLIGTPDAIAAAKRLIEDKIDMVGGGGGGRGGRNDRNDRNDSYSDPYAQQTQQQAYNPGPGQNNQPQGNPGAQAPNVDPYAAYGGYENYVNLWTQAMAVQAQNQQGGGQGENRPPGTS